MTMLIEVLGGTALFAVWLGAAACLWWAICPARREPSPLAAEATRLARRAAPLRGASREAPRAGVARGRRLHTSSSTARAMVK